MKKCKIKNIEFAYFHKLASNYKMFTKIKYFYTYYTVINRIGI